jgi:hypothetical protein
VALASDHISTVYAAIANKIDAANHSQLNGVYKTTGNGDTWSQVLTSLLFPDDRLFYNLAFGLSPVSGRLYIAGLDTVLESTVGATRWQPIRVAGAAVQPHDDFHAFAFGPDGSVYAGNDGGLWRYQPVPFELPITSSSVGSNPVSVVAAKLNADNLPDLAVANNGDSTVSVLLNNGDGTFPGAATSYSLRAPMGDQTNPVAIVSGDFKQDGRPDLAVANSTGSVSVLINNGDGRFPAGTPPTVDFAPLLTALATDDFNRDGTLDLVAASAGLGDFVVSFGNRDAAGRGDGTFGARAYYGLNLSPTAIATGRFNNDLFPDVVLANGGALNNVTVYLNNGMGQFPGKPGLPGAPDSSYAVGTSPVAIAVGQLNNSDTHLDLVVANSGDGTVSVLLGNGDGTFRNAVNYAAGRNPVALALADLNNDGNLDIVVANQLRGGGGALSILLGNGDGTFQAPITFNYGGPPPTALAVGDYNNDGRLDIAVTDVLGRLRVFLSNPAIAFASGAGTWANLNTPALNTIQANSVAMQPSSQDELLVGSQDNGVAQTSNATVAPGAWPAWASVIGADGILTRYDPTNAAGGANYAYLVVEYGAFWRSDAGGLLGTWAPKVTGLPAPGTPTNFPSSAEFAIDPLSPTTLLLGGNNRVYRTTNRGDNWAVIGAVLPANGGITALTYAPSDDQTIYVGFGDGQVFLSTDGGNTFAPVANPAPWGSAPVTSLAVDPNIPLLVYVGVSTFAGPQVYYDTAGGQNGWAPYNLNLPNVPVDALQLDATGGVLYAGTDIGVYSTPTAGAANWSRYGGTSLPYVQVRDLQLQTYGMTTYLAAATYGRGAWIIDPPPGGTGASGHGDGRRRPGHSSTAALAPVSAPQDVADLDPVLAGRLLASLSPEGLLPRTGPATGGDGAPPPRYSLTAHSGAVSGDDFFTSWAADLARSGPSRTFPLSSRQETGQGPADSYRLDPLAFEWEERFLNGAPALFESRG